MVSFIVLLFYMWGKFLCYALDSQMDGPQNSSGCYEEERHLFAFQKTPLLEFLANLKPTHYANLVSTPLMNTKLFLSTSYILLQLGLITVGYIVTLWHMWTYSNILFIQQLIQ